MNDLNSTMNLYNDSDMCIMESNFSMIDYVMESAAFEIEVGNKEFVPVYEAAESKFSDKINQWIKLTKAKVSDFIRKITDSIKRFFIKIRLALTKKTVNRIVRKSGYSSVKNVEKSISSSDEVPVSDEEIPQKKNIDQSKIKKIARKILIAAGAAAVVTVIVKKGAYLRAKEKELDEYERLLFGEDETPPPEDFKYEREVYNAAMEACSSYERRAANEATTKLDSVHMVAVNAADVKRAGDIIIMNCNMLLDVVNNMPKEIEKVRKAAKTENEIVNITKYRKAVMEFIDGAMSDISQQVKVLTNTKVEKAE